MSTFSYAKLFRKMKEDKVQYDEQKRDEDLNKQNIDSPNGHRQYLYFK